MIFTASLRENLLYGNNKNVDDTKILNLLEKFKTFNEESNYDLNKIVDNKSLSSGQTQKIAFIRALLTDLDLLLLDESTANLDDESSEKIFEIIRNNNITIINSTHDFDKFESIDNHIKIMIKNDKRIVEIVN